MKRYSFTLFAATLAVAILSGTFWPGKQALAQEPSPSDIVLADGTRIQARAWAWNGGVNLGRLNRGATGTLGTDDGGTISQQNLLFLENEEDLEEYFLELVHRFGIWGALWEVSFAYAYGMSDGDQLIDRVSPGAGNNLLIFGPQGPSGLTGGGLNAGARDAVGIHHSNDNEFHEFRLGFRQVIPLGPRWGVKVGPIFSYGGWDLTERIHGSVDGINQTFAYYNIADVTTYSIGAQLDMEHEIGTVFGTPVEYYGGLSFERQFHDNDGHSTLILSGLQNFTERQELGGDQETNRFKAYAGLSFELGKNLDLAIGGQYRSYSTAEVRILPNMPAYINLADADEYTGYVRLNFGFGPRAHKSPILGDISDRRLKRDIAHLATLENGIRLYNFRYLWSDQVHVGVMAQDLLAQDSFRDAVILKPNGFYAVDYARLGLKMATLEAWSAYGLAAVMVRPAPRRVGFVQPARVN